MKYGKLNLLCCGVFIFYLFLELFFTKNRTLMNNKDISIDFFNLKQNGHESKYQTNEKNCNHFPTNNNSGIILWSTWRSGSSLLGQMLSNSTSNSFYWYEPLQYIGERVIHNLNSEDNKYAYQFLTNLMECQFSHHNISGLLHDALERYVSGLNKTKCKIDSEICIRDVKDRCMEADIVNMKAIVRLSLKYGYDFLQKPSKDIRIVYLIRDPRATFVSRRLRKWCNTTEDCGNPYVVCRQLTQDLGYAKTYMRLFPSKFTVVQYEHFSEDPETVLMTLFKKLNIPITDDAFNVIEYMISSKVKVNGKKGSEFLSAKEHAYIWRKNTDFKFIETIQNSCEHIIKYLGFRIYNSEAEFKDENLPVKMENHTFSID